MTLILIIANYLNKAICSAINNLMHSIQTTVNWISSLKFSLLVLIEISIITVFNYPILRFLAIF